MGSLGFIRSLRARWVIAATVLALAVLAAAAYVATAPRTYEAKTRVFISAPSSSQVTDVYQGGMYTTQQMQSYVRLIAGRELAQRTVNALGLDMTPDEVASEVTATLVPETVLIDVTVADHDAARSAHIANGLTAQLGSLLVDVRNASDGHPPATAVVVDRPATIPSSPASPQPLRTLAMAALLGLILGVWAAVGYDRWSHVVRHPGDAGKAADTAELGEVPAGGGAPDFGSSACEEAEAYRRIASKLLAGESGNDEVPTILSVTGVAGAPPTAAITLSLARALAEAGRSVVIVDADLRSRAVSSFVGAEDAEGLTQVLDASAGQKMVDFESVIRSSDEAGVRVLPAGQVSRQPSAVLAAPELDRLLNDLRSRTDYVLVDTAPVDDSAETSRMCGHTQATLLVARVGRSKTPALRRTATTLRDSGVHILGVLPVAAR